MKTEFAEAFKENCSSKKLFEDLYTKKDLRKIKWYKYSGATIVVLLLGVQFLKPVRSLSFILGILLTFLPIITAGVFIFLIIQRSNKACSRVLNRHYGKNVSSTKERRLAVIDIIKNETGQLLRQLNLYEKQTINCLIGYFEDDFKNLSQKQQQIITFSGFTSIVSISIAIFKLDELKESRYLLAGIVLLAIMPLGFAQIMSKIILDDKTQKRELKDIIYYLKEVHIQLLSETPAERETTYSPGHSQETW